MRVLERSHPARTARTVFFMAAALAAAAGAGVYSVGHPKRALALGGLLVAGFILLDLNARKGTLVDRFSWVPWAWVALLLVTDLRFLVADPLAVTEGVTNIQHIIQLGTYAVVAALAVRARGSILHRFPRAVPKGLLLTFPVIAVISAAWSQVPLYTAVRGLQLAVLALLALLIVRIWASDPATGEAILVRTLRLFVRAVAILVVIGLLTAESLSGRFTWVGMHPGIAATYAGAALLVLVIGGRSWTRYSALIYWPQLILFGVALYLTQTRSVLAGVAVGIAVGLWFKGRQTPVARYLGVMYYLVGGSILALATALQLTGYLTRGETQQSIASLSGRIPLWEYALGQLDSVQEWAIGFGYGTSRRILLASPEFHWAGSAHSTWMELLLGVGLVGTLAAIATMLALTVMLVTKRDFGRSNSVALSILAFFLMASPISEGLALPGIGFGFLALLHVPALGKRATAGTIEPADRPPPRARAQV